MQLQFCDDATAADRQRVVQYVNGAVMPMCRCIACGSIKSTTDLEKSFSARDREHVVGQQANVCTTCAQAKLFCVCVCECER